jgi:hypothetical protein
MSRLTTKRRRRVRKQLPQICVQCGTTDELTIDHKIPRVYGGTNDLSNLQMLCLTCHRTKASTEVRHRNPTRNQQKGQALAAMLATTATPADGGSAAPAPPPAPPMEAAQAATAGHNAARDTPPPTMLPGLTTTYDEPVPYRHD